MIKSLICAVLLGIKPSVLIAEQSLLKINERIDTLHLQVLDLEVENTALRSKLEELESQMKGIHQALQAEANTRATAIDDLSQNVQFQIERIDEMTMQIQYFDPEIGGSIFDFDLTRRANDWCVSRGFIGGVANYHGMGDHRGLFCFREAK